MSSQANVESNSKIKRVVKKKKEKLRLLEFDIVTSKAKRTGSARSKTNGHIRLSDGNYLCKRNFFFYLIKEGNHVIWKAKNHHEYIKRLFVSCSGKDYIVIQLFNGNFVVFRKLIDEKVWSEITYKLPDLTKLKLLDESGNEVKEQEFSYGLISTDFIITFNFKCSEIKYDTHTVWKLEDSEEFPEALTISLKYQSILLLFKNDKKTEIDILSLVEKT
ncbi:SfiI-subtelomeric fragment related protein family member, putative [Theileria annulata]|uniref:SfiI-subtelomeric related protein family member, putative n=1 Tax=Theileria annulata TaxID=5874 RepID=Q4UJ21_THEAN|nr:SfiI-subtelomeric fragment related protein family member, putative [Theileria annulata]CAI72918.1 SfiI-subtelomeric fragment related protein family member, putative [Theileria annulata]